MRHDVKTVGELIDFLGNFDRDKEVHLGINEFFGDFIRVRAALGLSEGNPLILGMTDKFAKYIDETDRKVKDSMEYPELVYNYRTPAKSK